jgi:pimeloyl-ACP methyl ester carboxylesterase
MGYLPFVPAHEPVQRVARDVTARGVRMRVIEAGEGRGAPLVLIHGLLTSHFVFDEVIEAFAQNFHVIAPDLPGFGASEKPSPSRYAYGVETFAEAVADLIAAYGVGRANVLGHDLGGAVGITLAAQHAELVTRLVVTGPLCYAHPTNRRLRSALWPVLGSVIFKQLFGRRSFRTYFKDEVFSDGFNTPNDRIDRFYEDFNTPSARESAYAVLRAMLDTRPIVARVARIRHPTLVTWGRDDRIFPVSHAPKLIRQIPQARLELFDAGHSPQEERPDEFVASVTEFLHGLRR